eukprot:CAMPEP_0170274286 /NCGR_PEP_ID=MMETSP0116_2-20130129/37113_1 /TAXON_ID=400756 /ORGANISM="Durinskia baltica, Strain CSIRO CS-38" /LENGTH=59 /DNA_ID=CAMNT_0010525529 /DNA_START=110 /DNA_END=285 /DNA_ORIENTATION=-
MGRGAFSSAAGRRASPERSSVAQSPRAACDSGSDFNLRRRTASSDRLGEVQRTRRLLAP